MNKYYDLAFLQKQSAQFTNIDPLSDIGVSSFIKFNSYEINYLNISYQNIDITSHPSNSNSNSNSPPQATHTLLQNIDLAASTMHEHGINQSPQISSTETRKLKDLLWYLVKLDYIINFPNETVQFSTFNSAEQVLDPQLQITTPEQLFLHLNQHIANLDQLCVLFYKTSLSSCSTWMMECLCNNQIWGFNSALKCLGIIVQNMS